MPTEWTLVSTGLDGGLDWLAVGADSELDIWAVGGTPTSPADIYWSGTAWENLGLLTTTTPLVAVATQSPDDAWTITGPTLFHWDVSGWHTLFMNTNALAGLWAYMPGSVLAVGNGGTVLDCMAGTMVCTTATAGPADLTSVWGSAPGTAWAVGKGGAIYAYDGASWTAENGAVTSDLNCVQGSQFNDVWAVGDAIEHGPGTWTKNAFTPPGTLYGVYAGSPTEAWAVGKGGIILAWDGAHWKSTTSPTTNDLYSIAGPNALDLWAVGANNTVLHRVMK